ncbi:unnamed protein product [Angiostrongylus costaricensis]|uniref:AA_permease_C domain-containing protein n=1 Tax=Angiostrongylus costaricensis TaxID=334426 RepID=A0A158PK22_ANGCS|nr:unnamed protein product [Angiostrongylus costaricensis]
MRAVDIKNVLFRKKTFSGGSVLETPLKRCLGVIDVTFLAVGQMIGAGIYVLAGPVVHSQTGPSIIISFICAGFAALMSAFSYAEFGARYPRAGSAYTYTYVGIGELWAFVIGWTVILEYMIGNAAVARSWSAYFDTLVNGAISNLTLETVGSLSSGKGFFGRYPDIMSFLLICAAAIVVSLGSKSSASVNNVFVIFNIAVIAFVTIYGLSYANFSLWMGTDEKGKSRFFPFGLGGTVSGAATCFFAFIGFEVLATAGEEAKNPKRTIPLATFGCLSLVTFLYIMMCSALTLMVPYEQVSGVFALPRCVYAMAEDGLIFSCFARISKFSQVPLIAIVVFTILNATVALVFDLTALVEFLSIGTLLAYSMVSACVLILRHQAAPIDESPERLDNGGRLKAWVPFRNFWESLPQGRTICIAVVTLILGYFWLAFSVRLGEYQIR